LAIARSVVQPHAARSVRIVGTVVRDKEQIMIVGAHVVVYSKDPTADRAFFREVLGTSSVDAGHGWLIFALPPAELAVHPAEEHAGDELYFHV
jgi:hypothetical protein